MNPLQEIERLLQGRGIRVPPTWRTQTDQRARQIARYRRYADGVWDANMTPEMRAMLRVSPDPDGLDSFGANYCSTVLTTMADRLQIARIHADPDSHATQWVQDLWRDNRFVALMLEVHLAALRDGDSYLLIGWDNHAQQVRWSHQVAWDGNEGLILVTGSRDPRDVRVAIRVWRESHERYADTLRVSLFEADTVSHYHAIGTGSLSLLRQEAWTHRDGSPLGVPVIRFSNPARGTAPYGISELENVIPLQDLLNRVLYSMSIASELTAFPIYIAKGFAPPSALTPGMIVTIGAEGMERDQVAHFEKLEGSDTRAYIEQARFIIEQIYDTSKTPMQGSASSAASGEALKQREVALIGKARRFQARASHAWEDVLRYSQAVSHAYGSIEPPLTRHWHIEWEQIQPFP